MVAKYLRHEICISRLYREYGIAEEEQESTGARRALLVRPHPVNSDLRGAGVALDFYKEPAPDEELLQPSFPQRQSGQLNFLSVEEGGI